MPEPSTTLSPFWRERETRLRSLYADGVPARKIAETFGVTKNAVVGAANRLGLRHPAKLRKPPTPKRRHAATPKARSVVIAFTPKPRSRRWFATPPGDEPAPRCDSLLALGVNECKWPSGDAPDLHFCGHPTLDNGPWCVYHAFRASVESEELTA